MAFHKVIGIDLGTTYSAVSVWDGKDVVIIPSAQGSNSVPSVVGLDPETKVIVGAPAQANLVSDPANTIIEVKREMGTYEREPDPQTGDPGVPTRKSFRGREYLPQEISAFILMELKRQAENYIGEPIHDAVITVPASFKEPQRAATEDAAHMARLNVKRLLNEPTAAAVCFGADKVQDDRPHVYAVYDLGGGGFDVSIVAITRDSVNVVATNGRPQLGGSDFDDRIVGYALQQIKNQHGVDLSQDPAVWQSIKREAEMRKRDLTVANAATLSLPWLTPQPSSVNVPITRATFEALIDDLLKETLACLDRAIESAAEMHDVSRNDIEQVLLVGGSTRIPRVRSMLAEHLGMEEKDIRCDFSPDEVVARGAGMVARDYNPSDGYQGEEIVIDEPGLAEQRPAMILQDVTSHTIGILVNRSDFYPVIPKGSHMPLVQVLPGIANGGRASEIPLLILQGEDKYAFNNTMVGEVRIALPEPREEGHYKFEVTFALDGNSLLNVAVKCLKPELAGQTWNTDVQCNVRATKGQIDESAKHLAEVMAAGDLPVGDASVPGQIALASQDTSVSNTFDVFISYAAADRELVRPLVERLKRDGYRVWWDAEQIAGGPPALGQLAEGIAKSSHMIACLSDNYIERDWTAFELDTNQSYDPANMRSRTIPVVVRRLTKSLPNQLAPISLRDLTGQSTYDSEYAALTRMIQRQSVSELAAIDRHASQPPLVDENVQFTVYRPRTVRPDKWYDMLAFAHLEERRPDVGEDEPDPVVEVKRQAEQVLGEQAAQFTPTTQDSSEPVPREAELTFVPEIPGVEFNPSRRSFVWEEPVHREEFRLKASAELDGQVARGTLTVLLGSIILADVNLSIRVDSSFVPKPATAETVQESARPYRNIFASYSHSDDPIVEELDQHAVAVGDRYLKDVRELRSGEVWSEALEDKIREADIFQLFWSTNSMQSDFVEQEWKYAMGLSRPYFVRPVYWEEPLPECEGRPPDELKRLHFQRIHVHPGVAQTRRRRRAGAPVADGRRNDRDSGSAVEQMQQGTTDQPNTFRNAPHRRAAAEYARRKNWKMVAEELYQGAQLEPLDLEALLLYAESLAAVDDREGAANVVKLANGRIANMVTAQLLEEAEARKWRDRFAGLGSKLSSDAPPVDISGVADSVKAAGVDELRLDTDLSKLDEGIDKIRQRQKNERIRAWMEEAQRLIAKGQFRPAVKVLDKALAADPTSAPVLILKAHCWFGLDEFDRAIELLDQVQQQALDPETFVLALILRAACARATARRVEARIKELDEAAAHQAEPEIPPYKFDAPSSEPDASPRQSRHPAVTEQRRSSARLGMVLIGVGFALGAALWGINGSWTALSWAAVGISVLIFGALWLLSSLRGAAKRSDE